MTEVVSISASGAYMWVSAIRQYSWGGWGGGAVRGGEEGVRLEVVTWQTDFVQSPPFVWRDSERCSNPWSNCLAAITAYGQITASWFTQSVSAWSSAAWFTQSVSAWSSAAWFTQSVSA